MRDLVNTEGLDLRESARLLGYTWVDGRRHDDRLLGSEVPLHVLAAESGDRVGRHRREPGDFSGSRLDTARHGQSSRVPVRPQLLHGRRVDLTSASTSARRNLPPIVVNSTTTGTTRDLRGAIKDWVADVEDARVWGGLHYRTTVTETCEALPRHRPGCCQGRTSSRARGTARATRSDPANGANPGR